MTNGKWKGKRDMRVRLMFLMTCSVLMTDLQAKKVSLDNKAGKLDLNLIVYGKGPQKQAKPYKETMSLGRRIAEIPDFNDEYMVLEAVNVNDNKIATAITLEKSRDVESVELFESPTGLESLTGNETVYPQLRITLNSTH